MFVEKKIQNSFFKFETKLFIELQCIDFLKSQNEIFNFVI